jgi:hypothetical protein
VKFICEKFQSVVGFCAFLHILFIVSVEIVLSDTHIVFVFENCGHYIQILLELVDTLCWCSWVFLFTAHDLCSPAV